jgi:membrane protease YdiL (CAAX protease family)
VQVGSAGVAPARRLGQALLLLEVALSASVLLRAPGVGTAAALALLLLGLVGWALRAWPVAHLGLAMGLAWGANAQFELLPPISILSGLAAYAALVMVAPPLRRSASWFRRGRLDRPLALATAAVVVSSAAALLGWYFLLRPDVSDLQRNFAAFPFWAIPLVAIAFGLANAVAEEFLWRGIMQEGLQVHFPAALALAIQATSFGLVHFRGFPRGWGGVGLAAIYGLMLGELRRRAGGLLAPWIAHVFADVVIALVLGWIA